MGELGGHDCLVVCSSGYNLVERPLWCQMVVKCGHCNGESAQTDRSLDGLDHSLVSPNGKQTVACTSCVNGRLVVCAHVFVQVCFASSHSHLTCWRFNQWTYIDSIAVGPPRHDILTGRDWPETCCSHASTLLHSYLKHRL